MKKIVLMMMLAFVNFGKKYIWKKSDINVTLYDLV